MDGSKHRGLSLIKEPSCVITRQQAPRLNVSERILCGRRG